MKKINVDNKIFNDKEFLKDKYKFDLFRHIFDKEDINIYSDEENYIIILSKEQTIWIWTKDNIEENKVKEINIFLKEIENNISIICKKELYSKLEKYNNDLYQFNNYCEYGCYKCNKIIPPKKVIETSIVKGTEENKLEIAKLWLQNCEEKDPINKFNMNEEKALKYAEKFISSGSFYIICDDNKNIIAFADYQINGNTAEIAHAYTIPQYRNKGYMANLIYNISNKIIEKNLVPVLQTDINYIPSNKSYQKIGFVLEDTMVEVSVSKIVKKTKKI